MEHPVYTLTPEGSPWQNMSGDQWTELNDAIDAGHVINMVETDKYSGDPTFVGSVFVQRFSDGIVKLTQLYWSSWPSDGWIMNTYFVTPKSASDMSQGATVDWKQQHYPFTS